MLMLTTPDTLLLNSRGSQACYPNTTLLTRTKFFAHLFNLIFDSIVII